MDKTKPSNYDFNYPRFISVLEWTGEKSFTKFCMQMDYILEWTDFRLKNSTRDEIPSFTFWYCFKISQCVQRLSWSVKIRLPNMNCFMRIIGKISTFGQQLYQLVNQASSVERARNDLLSHSVYRKPAYTQVLPCQFSSAPGLITVSYPSCSSSSHLHFGIRKCSSSSFRGLGALHTFEKSC